MSDVRKVIGELAIMVKLHLDSPHSAESERPFMLDCVMT